LKRNGACPLSPYVWGMRVIEVVSAAQHQIRFKPPYINMVAAFCCCMGQAEC